MADATLTHPTRESLTLYQRQTQDDAREAVANITNELGTERPPLVHTETREREFPIRGRVTARKQATEDPDTSEGRQALANYVDRLEAHVDEFQGDGYTLADPVLDTDVQAILESVEWSITPGRTTALTYDLTAQVGRGTFDVDGITRLDPTLNTSLPGMLRVDGIDLLGMRDYQVARSIGIDPNAVFDRESAENNDLVVTEGAQRRVSFEGTITGSDSERQAKDDALDALAPTKEAVTLDTYFPGYSLDGFVTSYTSTQESRFGEERTDFRLAFVEGTRA